MRKGLWAAAGGAVLGAAVLVGMVLLPALDNRDNGCGTGSISLVRCPVDGTPLLTLPARGSSTVELATASGGVSTVDAVDLLTVADRSPLVDLPGGPASSTGDPVVDRFILAAQEYASTPAAPLPLDLHAVGDTARLVEPAWQVIAPLAGLMFGRDLQSSTIPLFVTDGDDVNHEQVTRLAGERGCTLSEQLRRREAGLATGAMYDLGMCASQPGLYLDLWQYRYLPGGGDPAGLMQTVSDEVMTVWQHRLQPSIRSGVTVPYWLYQGSQTLPFLIHGTARVGRPILGEPEPECLRAGLAAVEWEGYSAGSAQSCPHQLGAAAVTLLVARVGVQPVLDYFRADPSIAHETRFETMAGESTQRFAERFADWSSLRASRNARSGGQVSRDGVEYRANATRWLGP